MKHVRENLVDKKSALVQVMGWCQTGNKILPEPIMTNQPTHICHSILMGRIYWSSIDSYLSLILPLFITLSLPFPFSLTPTPLFLNTPFSFPFSLPFLFWSSLSIFLSTDHSICFPFLSISGSFPSLVSSGSLHPLHSLFFSFPLYATLSLSGFLSLPLSASPRLSHSTLHLCLPLPHPICLFSSVLYLPFSFQSLSFYHSLPLPFSTAFPLLALFSFILSLPSLFHISPRIPSLFYHFLCFTPHTLTFALFVSTSLFLSLSVHTLSLPHPLYLSTPPSTLLSPHLIIPSPSLILIFLSLPIFLSLSLFPFPNSTFLSLPYFLFFSLPTLPPAFSLPIFISPPPPPLS